MRYILALIAALITTPAFAGDHLVPYVGAFDVTQEDDEAVLYGLEYRYSDVGYGIRPTVGGFGTTDSGLYGYAGIHWDIVEWEGFYITPNFVAGAYSHGDGKDLGYGLEFRSGIELSYDVYNDYSVGVAFNHLSNASLGSDNPGTETLIFSYQIPLGLDD